MQTNLKTQKNFEVGKSYKCVDSHGCYYIKIGFYYKILNLLPGTNLVIVELPYYKNGSFFTSRFDINDCLEDKQQTVENNSVFAVVDHAGTIAIYSDEKFARDHVKYYDYGFVKQFTVKTEFPEEAKDKIKADIKQLEDKIHCLKQQIKSYD